MGIFSKQSESNSADKYGVTGAFPLPEKTNCDLNNAYEAYTWKKFYYQNSMKLCNVSLWEKIDTDYYKVVFSNGDIIFYDSLENTFRSVSLDNSHFDNEKKWCKEFSIRLNRTMKNRGIDQIKLSDLTGLSQSSISGYTRGVRSPSSYNCCLIAKALNCSLDYLQHFW